MCRPGSWGCYLSSCIASKESNLFDRPPCFLKGTAQKHFQCSLCLCSSLAKRVTVNSVKFSGHTSYLFNTILKMLQVQIFGLAACRSSPNLSPKYVGQFCWDGFSPAGLCFIGQFLGRKYPFLFGQQIFFAQELSYGLSYRDRGNLTRISFLYHLSSLSNSASQQMCLHKEENQSNL